MLTAAFLCAVMGLGPAWAGTTTDVAALAAYQTREAYCPDVGTLDVTRAAASVAQVATVWQQVSEAYEAERVSYILYWRGMLAQCLGYDGKATADLSAFIKSDADRSESAGMIGDARRRLKFLTRDTSPPPAPAPGAVLGVGCLIGSGVLGALAISQGVQVQANDESFAAQPHDAAARLQLLDERAPLVAAANGLTAASIASLTTSLVSLAISLATSRKAALSSQNPLKRQPPRLSLGAGPTLGGGLTIGIAGRW